MGSASVINIRGQQLESVLESAANNPRVQTILEQHGLQNTHIIIALELERAYAQKKRKSGLRNALRSMLSHKLESEKQEGKSWLDCVESRSVSLVKLCLDSFRSYSPGTVFHFGGLPQTHFVMAPNGHGKTTLLQALRFLFRGSNANNLKASKADKDDFLWDCLSTDVHRTAYPEAKVEATFLVDGHTVVVTRKVKTKRMWPDCGRDLIDELLVEVDSAHQSEPEAALEQWFGRNVLLDYHIFDAEASRVRFTGHSADNQQMVRGDDSAYSVQNCLQEFIGLDIVSTLIADLKKIIKDVSRDLTETESASIEWIEFNATLQEAQERETNANELLISCGKDIEKLEQELAELLEKLGSAEAAAELVALECKLKEEQAILDKVREGIIEDIKSATPWLHIIISRNHLRSIGGRNSGDEARRIIDLIIEEAPLDNEGEVRVWLEEFRKKQAGEPGASELIGRGAWENIEHAIDSVQAVRIPVLWQRLIDLREREIILANKFTDLNTSWSSLPEDYDVGDKEVLASLGLRKIQIESTIITLQERQRQLSTSLTGAQENLQDVSASPPSGGEDDGNSTVLMDELHRIQDLERIMVAFQEEVTTELRQMVETVASNIFQKMMRKDDLALSLDENYKFQMLDITTQRSMPLPSAGEETIAVLAFLSALQQVTGLELPFIIDSALHRLDCHHQSQILQHFVSMERQAVVFLTEKDWESFNEDDRKSVLSQVLTGIHPPNIEERFELMESIKDVESFNRMYAKGGA
jgi:DNA sulfur modification protein DndD